jgi:DNA repair protein RadC
LFNRAFGTQNFKPMKTTSHTANLFNSTVAEIEITYRNRIPVSQMRKVLRSQGAYDIFRDIWSDQIDHVEEFYVLFLNRSNQVLGYSCLFRGGLSGTIVDPKIVFQHALKANASGIIVAHNHPSGNIIPSGSDENITKKLAEAGKFIEIAVLDSMIITSESYYSFCDEGRL